ncbi:hypothetical protein DOTSEDRAFT_29693 [Dothistroma septosporum NZE10]|uniref:RRM domain-containing protein n=1 Tax=Dothistroma septosporum (strain NZE10 / CBS 128990) TaxID=675120 RepID=M2WHM5_DOTSN|nr:hypothetical protein DOTSEDRAFT_29693 [Dothistroma septosporum NZE10]
MPIINVPGVGPPRVSTAGLREFRRSQYDPRDLSLFRRHDHFANTSLDESGPVLPPPQLRHRAPTDMQARQDALSHRGAREEAEDEDRRERTAGHSADCKAVRLDSWRNGNEPFRRVLTTAIKLWKQTGAPDALAFEKHLTNAMLAADKEKTVYDIAGWFPNLPHNIHFPLRDVCKRLHGEARMMYELVEKEDEAGGMVASSNIHPELPRGTCCTIVDVRRSNSGVESVRVDEYPNFGTDPDHLASLDALDSFDPPHALATTLTPRQTLIRIRAQLETRSMLLQPRANTRFETTSTNRLHITYLKDGVDKAALQQAFARYGNAPHSFINRPQSSNTPTSEPASAVVAFEHAHEAARAHVEHPNATIEGQAIKIAHVTPDASRTTTWEESIDYALYRWCLYALNYVKGKLDDCDRAPSSIADGRLIASVHNQIKAFCKLHNFGKIAYMEAVDEEHDNKVVMNDDASSTPELRAELDQMEEQLEIFEEEFGAGILGQDWRMSQRSRRGDE